MDHAELRRDVQGPLGQFEKANSLFSGSEGATIGVEVVDDTSMEAEGEQIGGRWISLWSEGP